MSTKKKKEGKSFSLHIQPTNAHRLRSLKGKILPSRVSLSCQKHTFIINFSSHTTKRKNEKSTGGKTKKGGKFILTIVFLFNYAPLQRQCQGNFSLFFFSLTFCCFFFHGKGMQSAVSGNVTINRRK